MDFIFADDSRQKNPSRPGMGPLVAIGGIYVPGDAVKNLEREIDNLCSKYKFPPRDEFKWSPGRELWMRSNLIGEDRQNFFLELLSLYEGKGIKAIIIIEDTNYNPAITGRSAEEDVSILFLERAHKLLAQLGNYGVIIVDRPSGDRGEEDKFLSKCLETIQAGTSYVKPERIAINVLSTPSKLIRILQLADVIASSTMACVSGESNYSLPIFKEVKKLLWRVSDRIGGVGLKIHPDYIYVNLYHWLLGDEHYWKGNMGIPLPIKSRCFYKSQNDT